MYLITNGKIITEAAVLEGFELLIKEDRIEQITFKGEIPLDNTIEVIDAKGGYISPGFIDLHSDYIEHMAAPRPTAMMDFRLSLWEAEKELISHGITTMYHSLSLYKFSEYEYKPIREPENVRKFMNLIDETHTRPHLARHRFHARFEIDNVEEVNSLKSYIAEKKVHLVSFMDHTPGQGQYRNLEVYRDTVKSYNNMTDGEINNIITWHMTKEKVELECLKEIALVAKENNIAVASHDDDSLKKLEFVKSLGAGISEFPITMEVAKKAQEFGMYTIAGAPNVLLGGSHSGNLSAAEAIQEKAITILCSDYYPAAMLNAVFKMNKEYGMDLAELVRLVTINPAKAVKMDSQIGSIQEGKKADLLIIEKLPDDFPVITAVMVDGRLVQKTNYPI